MSSFQLRALDPAPFQPLFALSDAELGARGIRRVRADAAPGFPCRVSLEDARTAEVVPGTEVASQLAALFADPSVAYVHLHNARQGCYSCNAVRA